MIKRKNKWVSPWGISFFCLIIICILPIFAFSEEIYQFERMWPVLPQPWYFYAPHGIAIDEMGNVYVVDKGKSPIKKFTLEGEFIIKWGERGSGREQLNWPTGIAIDGKGNVYVADTWNDRIQIFTSDGQFITTWGGVGSDEGQFDNPCGIVVDDIENIYVLEYYNHRIQKFTSEGQFITMWGNLGSGDGEFDSPCGIAIDNKGNVYVADTENHRIQKFTPEGQFITTWGIMGSGDGEFDSPYSIAIDNKGNVYVADTSNHRIQKFSHEGQFINKWGSKGTGDKQFWAIADLAIDSNSNIYVTDHYNHCIQKFTSEGQFIIAWSSAGIGEGQFNWPANITIDGSGNIYITDEFNHRIQKLLLDGEFITSWGGFGTNEGEFNRPSGIALDASGSVYVTDKGNYRIQKFTSSGQFITTWGSEGKGDGQFDFPDGIAIDSLGNVYVTDVNNHRVQKFTSDGKFIKRWGSKGNREVEFLHPSGIAIDLNNNNNIYIADKDNHRIQTFTADGQFITMWGGEGGDDGEFNRPDGIAIDELGNIYVADRVNSRIQKFSPVGLFISTWGEFGSNPGQFNEPSGLAISTINTKIYVVDNANNRIQVFNRIKSFPSSNEIYKFERMWPTLQQPWYFRTPSSTAKDYKGNIYVADRWNHQILKFTSEGKFITKWGSIGSDIGEFTCPEGIAVNSNGDIYVADLCNNRIQKFTSEGQIIISWGSEGSADGQLRMPIDIAIDSNSNVYVTEYNNHRVQKFTSEGVFITKWGSYGSKDGQFNGANYIGIDESGSIYVTEYDNHRIQKFTCEGEFITKWGGYGSEDGKFNRPNGIAIDEGGNIYIADSSNYRIQKFTSEGQFITKWGEKGFSDGKFFIPGDLTIDNNGYVYVPDYHNSRIQKFTTDGQFITKWGGKGSAEGWFNSPRGIAIDSIGNIYVADLFNGRIQKFTADGQFILMSNKEGKFSNEGSSEGVLFFPYSIVIDNSGNVYIANEGSIQKFTSEGEFITKWGSEGSGDGQFQSPINMAIDGNNYIYIADIGNHRIQSFTPHGEFITKWGSYGSDNGQFNEPWGIAADGSGNIYVADTMNDRVQKFTTEGTFISTWGSYGSGDGQFDEPRGIAIDGSANVYVADRDNIQKFAPSGVFITNWSEYGSGPGQVSRPFALVVGLNGSVYVSDTENNRIQVFKPVTKALKSKAIIVAGGGPYPGNNLWEATQLCANFAYRTLTFQGFTKESICYLTPDLDLDLDDNDISDEVYGEPTYTNLQQAITKWAADANNVTVYLTDHGGEGTFRMSDIETLSAADLGLWLDELQGIIPGKVVVIYDACESGSFLERITPLDGKKRIIISSTSPGESAYFISHASISFSHYFWTHIFNGLNLLDAFSLAQEALSHTIEYQNPLLDDSGDGIGNQPDDGTLAYLTYIGNGTEIFGEVPCIGSISKDQMISGTNSALLYATDVTDSDGIGRVWAVIRPPDYCQVSAGSPVQEFPVLDLLPVGENRYEGEFSHFNISGTYQIALYAMDKIGNTSIPKLTTVSVENPLKHKAVIAVGGSQSEKLWSAQEKCATFVYEALIFQGYTDDDIYFMSPVTFSAGVDGLTTLGNFNHAIMSWTGSDTEDLILYLVGNGGSGSFQVNNSETLSATDLDIWLDSLQDTIPGKITVIYDACQSGSFLPCLMPHATKNRIVIASASKYQPAYFLSQGDISFSRFFWQEVLNGANLRDAFMYAKKAVSFFCSNQVPQLDDNGNGIGNEKKDGDIARYYKLGVGIMLAGDAPVISGISSGQTLTTGTSAPIRVENVTATGKIGRVWAVITPPEASLSRPIEAIVELPTIDLVHLGNGRYEGIYDGFVHFGAYQVTAYAKDQNGTLSLPQGSTVIQAFAPDLYEEDNTINQATIIVINAEAAQHHNFHDAEDEDWVKFYGIANEIYTIRVSNAGPHCDTVIELYNTDGSIMLASSDDASAGEDECIEWQCTGDGVYLIKIKNFDPHLFGEGTGYDLVLYHPIGPLQGIITGNVTDSITGQPIEGVLILTDGNASALTLSNGLYFMMHPLGTFTIIAKASGYKHTEDSVTITEASLITKDFSLTGDRDKDGFSDVDDAFPNDENEWMDTDGDGIGNNKDEDDDNDKMPDAWEARYGLGPLVNNADEDLDGDYFTNFQEYLENTLPNDANSIPLNHCPAAPEINYPTNNSEIILPQLILSVINTQDEDGDILYYFFEVFSDEGLTHIVCASNEVLEGENITEWQIDIRLEDNTYYYWRVQVFDEHRYASPWSSTAIFMVNIPETEKDITPPEVISTYPDNALIDVPIKSDIIVRFSEIMDALSFTNESFFIKKGSSKIQGIVIFQDMASTATLRPETDLDPNTIYTVIIMASVKDIAGNFMEADYTWSFKTGKGLDTIPPSVLFTDPNNGSIGVNPSSAITAIFSEIMDSATITSDSFFIFKDSHKISGTVTYSDMTATFRPDMELDYKTTYSATITTSVNDLAGNPLEESYTWSFTTVSNDSSAPDSSPPPCFITALIHEPAY